MNHRDFVEAGRGRICPFRLVLAGTMLLAWCAGCGGNSGSGSATTGPSTGEALVVGDAGGVVLDAIQSRYGIFRGKGRENPQAFSMIVFDGSRTTPQELQNNPGVNNFLAAGKPVVILNNTEAHRATGLSGKVWAHGEGSSPAVAFLIPKDGNGTPQQLVQVDFPAHPPSATTAGVAAAQNAEDSPTQQDSEQFLDLLDARSSGAPGNIAPASIGPGQTILSFDEISPRSPQQSSVLNGQPPPPGTAWGPNGTQPPNFSTSLNVTFETRVYAIFEGNSASTYQHKIIARQYLLVGPPNPLATELVTTQYAIIGSNWNGRWPVYSTLGFNNKFEMVVQLLSGQVLGISKNLPESINGVTTLTTSEQHTETLGLSTTWGVQNGNGLGTVGASWSDSWTWGKAQTVQFQDWDSNSQVDIPDDAAIYNFTAFSGSDVPFSVVSDNQLELPPNNTQIANSSAPFTYFPLFSAVPNFNQLQTSAMTNQTETEWETDPGNPVPPETAQLLSSAQLFQGELLELLPGVLAIPLPFGAAFTGIGNVDIDQVIDLNFGAPALQPPGWNVAQKQSVSAPWTLTFGQPVQKGSNWTVPGTITLNTLQSSPTTINLTYVVQPQEPLLTLGGICPGNQEPFAPGPGVVSNAPLSVTIPANSKKVNIAPNFEGLGGGAAYNVQVVAWQPSTTIDGNTILNPQSAYCITVPGS